MITLNTIKQDYKEITDLMANYTFSLEGIKELNDHLLRTGHKTLIEINGEPIDEIEYIKDSEIKWIRLDDYNNLNYIYFNKDWQTNENEKVMFDAYIGYGSYFIENINIKELDDKYLEIIGIAELNRVLTENKEKSPIRDYKNNDYRKKVSEYINGNGSSDILTICKTPNSLKIVGATAENVTISTKVIQNSINPPDVKMSGHTSGHGVSINTIEFLAQYIINPILIANGNKNNTIVAITEEKDNNDNNIILPIEINKLQKGVEVNKVLSIYGKEHIKNYLNKLIDNNSILAYNKEKAEELFTVTGANSPAATSIICYDNSISYSMENVKYPANIIEEMFVTAENIAAFAENSDWKYRREAAWSDIATPKILEKLSKDPDESVRQAVAVNRNTPLDALKRLCADEDADVRNYAKETVSEVFLKDQTSDDYEDFLYSVKSAEFEKAKNYISTYLHSEYSSEEDFSNLFHIGIGYTEIGSEEQGDFSFQVEANLVDCEINYYIDGEIAKTEKYDSLAEMNECRLSCLDFEEFLHIGTTELDRILEEKEKAAPVKVVLAVSQYDTSRYYIANNATEETVRNIISNSDKIFMDICALGGKQIDEATFAKYSQTEGITAIDVNIDEQIMHVYDAEKPINSFDDIRSNIIRCSDFINQLDDVIATCLKMKEALMDGKVELDKYEHSVGLER